MMRRVLRSKIHRATVTDANLTYNGSLTLDEDLMDAAGLAEWEIILVANLANGTRHETYLIPGARGSGIVCANGAAARLVSPGDEVIILCFGWLDEADVPAHRPPIVLVDKANKITETL